MLVESILIWWYQTPLSVCVEEPERARLVRETGALEHREATPLNISSSCLFAPFCAPERAGLLRESGAKANVSESRAGFIRRFRVKWWGLRVRVLEDARFVGGLPAEYLVLSQGGQLKGSQLEDSHTAAPARFSQLHPLPLVRTLPRFGVGVSLLASVNSRKVKRFRGVLASKAHRPLHHSTLGSKVMKKKERSANCTLCISFVSCEGMWLHTMDDDPFIESQLASVQLTSGSYVVQIWSRIPPN